MAIKSGLNVTAYKMVRLTDAKHSSLKGSSRLSKAVVQVPSVVQVRWTKVNTQTIYHASNILTSPKPKGTQEDHA